MIAGKAPKVQPGADWPQFHGDAAHSGVAEDTLEPSKLGLAWVHRTPGVILTGSPVVADGVAYVGTRDEDGLDTNAVHAVDLKSGRALWKFHTDASVHGTLAVADGIVYAPTIHGTLHAIDAAGGQELWKREAERPGAAGAPPRLLVLRAGGRRRQGLLALPDPPRQGLERVADRARRQDRRDRLGVADDRRDDVRRHARGRRRHRLRRQRDRRPDRRLRRRHRRAQVDLDGAPRRLAGRGPGGGRRPGVHRLQQRRDRARRDDRRRPLAVPLDRHVLDPGQRDAVDARRGRRDALHGLPGRPRDRAQRGHGRRRVDRPPAGQAVSRRRALGARRQRRHALHRQQRRARLRARPRVGRDAVELRDRDLGRVGARGLGQRAADRCVGREPVRVLRPDAAGRAEGRHARDRPVDGDGDGGRRRGLPGQGGPGRQGRLARGLRRRGQLGHAADRRALRGRRRAPGRAAGRRRGGSRAGLEHGRARRAPGEGPPVLDRRARHGRRAEGPQPRRKRREARDEPQERPDRAAGRLEDRDGVPGRRAAGRVRR